MHGDDRGRGPPGARNHGDLVLAPCPATRGLPGSLVPGIASILAIVGQEGLVGVPLVAGAVLKPAGQAALVLPVNGHPAEVNGLILRQRRTAGIGIPDRAYPPGAILQTEGGVPIDLQLPAVVADPALPEAELVEPGGIHDHVTLVAQGLATLLDTGRARRKHQVALDTGVIGLDHHPVATHGLQYVQGKGPDRGIRGLQRGARREP